MNPPIETNDDGLSTASTVAGSEKSGVYRT